MRAKIQTINNISYNLCLNGFSVCFKCNNIDKNKEFIIGNINKFVSNEYYKLYSALAIYEINDINVASRLKEEWIKEIADNLVDIIYNGQDAMTRITQVNNRLNVCVNEYSTYINNKTFNT